MTLIELLVAMTVMTVAVTMLTSMVVHTTRQRGINRENMIASNAARVQVELMRNESFQDVFALYNAEQGDDPLGAGTAPGHRFEVYGLTPLPDSADGRVGEVFFPVGPGAEDAVTLLREDVVDKRLGMPRDLNGDDIVDEGGHGEDYVVLPVRVRVEWRGDFGPRKLDLYTQLTQFKVEEH
jgi:type II secretory pathway pseudopilin PulG